MRKVIRFISFKTEECPSCQNLLEKFKEIKINNPTEVGDCRSHFDNKPEYEKHNVQGIPTTIMFDESGNEIKRLIGSDYSIEELQNWIND